MNARIFYCFYYSMTYFFVQANIGEVHTALRVKMYNCIHQSNSLQGTLRYQQMCLESLNRCLVFLKPRGWLYMEINMGLNQLCGGLNTGEDFQKNTWEISIPGKLGMYIVIHHFQLPAVEQKGHTLCRRASVHVTIKGSNQTFCGHRVPWNISSLSSNAQITLFTIDKEQRGCYFAMSFEAFDKNSSSTGLVQENFQILQKRSRFFTSKIMKRARVNNVFMTRHKNPFSFYKTEIQLHVLTNIFKHIAVRYSTRLVGVQVYDGPGPLSPIVPTFANSTSFRTAVLTSFQGYIKYMTLLCTFNCEISLLNESELSWSSTDMTIRKHFKDCVQRPNVSTSFRTTSGYCHPQRFHSYITIQQLRFSGFDTLYEGSYHALCHYGGLFIVFYPGKTAKYKKRTARYFTLCSSVT